jgi:transposase InsO family protein
LDRDKLFISKFWKGLIEQIGIDYRPSIAYYPQTNGQTERINQIMKIYLSSVENGSG